MAPSGRYAPDYASSWGIGHPAWQSGRSGNGNRGRDRDRGHDRDHDRDRSRSPYLGYGYGYPIYNTWAVMPWDLGYADASGADNSQNAAPDSYEPAQQEYAPPDEYRPPYGAPVSDYAPPPPAAAAPVTTSTVLESEPALTLIFKDGHQQSIRNYALTADAVLVFDKAATGRQERIPLADLNLAATEEAAQAAGLDFAPPQ